MAWLSGLAGKAENLLNKIDQNTAAVLNKEKNDQLAEVMWMPQSESPDDILLDPSFNFPYKPVSSIETPEQLNTNLIRNDELITYFNITPVSTPTKSVKNAENGDLILHLSPDEPNLQIEHDSSDTSSVRSVDAVLNVDDLSSQNGNLCLTNIEQKYANGLPDVVRENVTDESTNVREINSSALQNDEYSFTRHKTETDTLLMAREDSVAKKQLRLLQKEVEDEKGLLDKQQANYQKEIKALIDKLQSYSVERTQFLKRISELQLTLDRNRSELNFTRSELEQHRARALKTLQEKEKLIAELRGNANSGLDEATAMELNQVRQEREVLREENQQICEQLRLAREELVVAELKLEAIRQKAIEVRKQAQETISAERRKRLDAEEDARLRTEETRSLKEEFILNQNSTSQKLKKQETEITRLRTQLSAASTPSSEVESRLATLTQTLVLKQQALESLTTERNALRLQLEKLELEYRNSRKSLLYNSVNDTDDAKVPTFLMETPFDTGVTRRVKRAYSSLDAISIRTGVFLRRYPLARILVFIYMVLLQFWVLVVLFSQSPEAH